MREAVEIVEASLGDEPDPRSLLLRAEAFSAAEEHGIMLETLGTLARRLRVDGQDTVRSAIARRARELARGAPVDDPELAWLRDQIYRLYGLDPRRGA